ncbi:MAG: tetratricopeptide repeat protein, partial [Phycisphaerae bacterium]|nr:tetratricopeptide repeat protein [Phycisphaerae bacterium]
MPDAHLTIPQALKLAGQHERAGQAKDAQTIYERVLNAQPDHVAARKGLARLLRSRGDAKSAIDTLRLGLAARPKSVEFQRDLAALLRSSGRLEEAIETHRH